ncbi:MAG: hypothetical protein PVF05_02025 [Gemmatimonadales bacterium]|jgi:hypothetical protein
MATRTRLSLNLIAAAALTVSCGGTPTGPPRAEDVKIIVHTTGGISGMDWTVTLDGADGEARCSEPCPWAPQTRRVVSDADVESIAAAFVDAGVRRHRDTDFGLCTGCADQFHHEMVYRDGTGIYHVEGDGPNLPDELSAAVARIIFPTSPE